MSHRHLSPKSPPQPCYKKRGLTQARFYKTLHPAGASARFFLFGLRTASCARLKMRGISCLSLVSVKRTIIPPSNLNDTVHSQPVGPELRMTSMGHRVQVPTSRGSLICEMASRMVLLPALWLLIPTIIRS